MIDLEDFRKKVKTHDLTYDYSDEGNVWRSGYESFKSIIELANKASHEQRPLVEKIWNEIVDQKIQPGYAEPFYWNKAWWK